MDDHSDYNSDLSESDHGTVRALQSTGKSVPEISESLKTKPGVIEAVLGANSKGKKVASERNDKGKGRKPLQPASANTAGKQASTSGSAKRKIDDVDSTTENPSKEKKQDATPTAKKSKTTPKKTSAVEKKQAQHPDISDIHLDGESQDAVKVFESCGEIRKKITAHLNKDGVKQAGFLRELSAQYHTSTTNVSSASLRTFRGKKGTLAGNTSAVYYASYVFFEKVRIQQGKAKSKHREDMEREWPRGVDVTRDQDNIRMWCGPGERPYKDKFGKTHIGGRLVT